MSFRGGGRRFNNRHSGGGRGGSNSVNQHPRQGGFSMPNNENPNQRSNRPAISKPKICMFFQQGSCTAQACRDLHQYSYNNEIGRLQQVALGSPAFASCLVQNSQVCVALQGRVAIFDLKTAQSLAEFQVKGRTKVVSYSEDFGQGYIFFAGDANNRQLIGAINTAGTIANFAETHSAGVNCMVIRNGLIFVGADDAKVSVWYLNQTSFEFGVFLEIESSLQAQVLSLEIVGNFVFAGLANGRIVGWEYNFENNSNKFVGGLSLGHNGRVACLCVLADRYLFSAGEDGIVNCWDSQTGFQGGNLLNATKAKPVQISSMLICEGQSGTFLLLGTNHGKILWYTLQGSEAKFTQPLSYHRKSITGLLKLDLEGHRGFISSSIDGLIHVSNWNMA